MADSLVGSMQDTDHRDVGGLQLDIGKAGGARIKRIIYPPGFRWSTHMKPVVNTAYCMHAHVGFLAQGRVHVQYEDVDTVELIAPQFVSIEPGHDAWVVGDEAAVLIEFDFERDTVKKLGMPEVHHHLE
jgi:hypothetical protein